MEDPTLEAPNLKDLIDLLKLFPYEMVKSTCTVMFVGEETPPNAVAMSFAVAENPKRIGTPLTFIPVKPLEGVTVALANLVDPAGQDVLIFPTQVASILRKLGKNSFLIKTTLKESDRSTTKMVMIHQ